MNYESIIGKLTLVSDGYYLIGLFIENQKYYGSTFSEKMIEKEDLAIFQKTTKWLDKYFMGKNPSIKDIPLKFKDTEFRTLVWNLLLEIPYGEIRTYKDIALKVIEITNKKNMSYQAIAGAISHNPISIIVPCHRVIGVDGNLVGYAGGLENKKKLLEIENKNIVKLPTMFKYRK